MSQLKTKYQDDLRATLVESLGLKNTMQAPKLEKIILNLSVDASNRDILKDLTADLATIAGQAPAVTKAKKSISNFKLREGMEIGARVTLRGKMMYDFLDRLVNAALPRIRDFRGVPTKGFDGRGNYNFGLVDQTIFPEIDPDKVKEIHGMNVTIVTSTKNDDHALALLKGLGMPFENATS